MPPFFRIPRRGRKSAFALFAFVLLSSSAFAADLGDAEKLAAKWADLRTETGRLESDWQWQRNVLASTQEALQQEVQQLEAERALLLPAQARHAREMEARNRQIQQHRTDLASIEGTLQELSQQAVALQSQLPPRLAAAVELPLKSLADPKLSVAERMQHLASFQSRCEQFNRLVTYSEEAVVISSEKEPRLLEILYWGLAAAYGLDRAHNQAYAGNPGPSGWMWQPIDGAESVRRLIQVHQDEIPPVFVDLPVRLKQASNAEGGR